MQINSDYSLRAVVQHLDLPWVSSPAGGVERRMLERDGDDPELADMIRRFREDEREHKIAALEAGAEKAPGYPLLSAAIRLGCKVAIRVSQKI